MKCEYDSSISILGPSGEPVEVDACDYVLTEAYKNVSIYICTCIKCGNVSIGWMKQPDTEEIPV